VITIQAGRILTPLESFASGTILIEGEKIAGVGSPAQVSIPAYATLIDATDKIVVPGFIDTHTHGRDGAYFGEDAESTVRLCRSIASSGITSLLPTLASLLPVQYTMEMILARIANVRQAMRQGTGGAEILGIHMEGPYLSSAEAARGSQLPMNMRRPSVAELRQMVEASSGSIRKMSIAPELDGALDVIREMVNHHILPCAAHSTASFEQAMQAVGAGLCCAAHVFNGMPPLHHRSPGLLGAILTCDQVHAELIADGQHVSPAAMQVLLRCKGVERVHLVTDNTPWAGLPDGTYPDGERTIVKEAGRAYVAGGTLIGSVAPMNICVRNMVNLVGCSLAEAVQMASLNPARVIGADERKGSLAPGKDADLVIIDEDVNVYMTLVRGQVVYRAGGTIQTPATQK
jgi:N-acetylglucosamine-6-phosphate deacetylase